MKLIINIPEEVYKRTIFYKGFYTLNDCVETIKALEKGVPLDTVTKEIEINRDRNITGNGEHLDVWLDGYRTGFNESLAIIELETERTE